MLLPVFSGLVLGSVLAVSALSEPLALDTDLEASYAYLNQHPISFPQESAQDELSSELPHVAFPQSHPHKVEESRTVFQVLSDDPKFSRLVKVINISDEIVSLLNDSSNSITFFATPNWALPHPDKGPPHEPLRESATDFEAPRRHKGKGFHPHHDKHSHNVEDNIAFGVLKSTASHDLSDAVKLLENLELSVLDESEKEEHKKFIKKIITGILSYHILPSSLKAHQLAKNATFATSLHLPHAEPLRIKVDASRLPPSLKINLFTKVVKHNVHAANGVIHVVNHPLFPPPSTFQELYMAQSGFSVLTSALQRTGLTDELDFRYVPGEDGKKGSIEGTQAVTFFAPTNHAFLALPEKLQHFLFSPFGETVLKKLLQYHVVPNFVLHSDYAHNASSSATVTFSEDSTVDENANGPDETQSLDDFMEEYEGSAEHRDNGPYHRSSRPTGPTFPQPPRDRAHRWRSPSEISDDQDDRVHARGPSCPPPPPGHHEPYSRPPPPPPGWGSPPPGYGPPPPPGPPGRPEHGWYPPPPPGPPPFLPSDGEFPRPFPSPPGGPFSHPPPPRGWGPRPPPPRGPPPSRNGEVPPHFPPPPGSWHEPYSHPPPPGCGPPPPEGPGQHGWYPPPPPGPPPFPRDGGDRDEGEHPPPFPSPPPGLPSQQFPHPHPPKQIFAANLTLPTLLTNQSLHVHIAKYKAKVPIPHTPSTYFTKFFVNGRPVGVADIVSINGAVHIVDRLLNPRGPPPGPPPPPPRRDGFFQEDHGAHENGWEGWEDWLVRWAEQN